MDSSSVVIEDNSVRKNPFADLQFVATQSKVTNISPSKPTAMPAPTGVSLPVQSNISPSKSSLNFGFGNTNSAPATSNAVQFSFGAAGLKPPAPIARLSADEGSVKSDNESEPVEAEHPINGSNSLLQNGQARQTHLWSNSD